MEIVPYRELEHNDEFMILMELAFWSPLSPTRFEKLMNLDLRLRNGPVGFCAVEDGRFIAFVGVMDIPTRTINGNEEMVGGIYDVATNPAFTKKGVCKALMERAHQYFEEKKYPFSFLFTNRTIIAYPLYLKMDYAEVEKFHRFPLAYKVLRKDKAEKKLGTKLKPEKIYEIYHKFVKGKTGFVGRQKDFVNLFTQWKSFDAKKSIQEKNGYALLLEMRGTIKIRELINLDDQTYEKLLDQVESLAPAGVVDRLVNDERLLGIYKTRGYSIQKGDHLTFMAKKLGNIEFEEAYGDNFHLGGLDLF